MEKADKISKIRAQNHASYAKYLKNIEWQKWDDSTSPCSISFGALAQNIEHRKAIVKKLVENKIETRLFSAGNLGRHPFWVERYGEFRDLVSDRVHDCGFFLPNNESISEEDAKYISEIVNLAKI